MVYSGFSFKNGIKLFYEIINNGVEDCGFDIYVGENSKYPTYHQPEPYIPNPSLSYRENAIKMCEELSKTAMIEGTKRFEVTEEMYNSQQSDIDYLMLLNTVSI